MKTYRVIFDRDGTTVKAPGVASTEVIREELYYAAHTFSDVWHAIADLRKDQERSLVAIIEDRPAITILNGKVVDADLSEA